VEARIEDHIGIYEEAYSEEYCDQVVSYFEILKEQGYTHNRIEHESAQKNYKDDLSIHTSSVHWASDRSFSSEISKHFLDVFWGVCYPHYAQEYPVLLESENHYVYGHKIQETSPSQGYHVWHYETGSRHHSNRLMAWILYLDDIEEGGETEFLYQRKRIKPQKGTLVIFPASYTHTHRGNPPLSGVKHIMTGWVEY
jgi:hypothetical protein